MATMTADLYKGSIKIGSGTLTDGGADATVSSYTGTSGLSDPMAYLAEVTAAGAGRPFRNVRVQITSSTHVGKSFWTSIMSNDGAGNLVMKNATPYTN